MPGSPTLRSSSEPEDSKETEIYECWQPGRARSAWMETCEGQQSCREGAPTLGSLELHMGALRNRDLIWGPRSRGKAII